MDTLKGKQTEMSPYMELVKSIERFEWEAVERLSRELAIPQKELSNIFLQALRWSQGIENEIH
ncbi:hypothetical protein CW313_13445 [Acinetobacter radioresistens]|nr:hypothetical protein CW313_13445 [Acinetobacter radioresistens]